MNAVKVERLRKSFDDKLVLDDVSLSVNRGDIYGFIGPNGSGKTTTLRILLGILRQDKGNVNLLDMDPVTCSAELHRRVNALPESHGLYGWMSPQAYLRFFAELYGVSLNLKDAQSRLQQVGLNPDDHRPIHTFSQGMRQRLGIARAMVNDPELLILDEPTNGLDPRGRREIHDLFLTLNRERGITLILSTHILDDVERLCTRLAILDRGKIRYEGPLAVNLDQSGRVLYRFHIDEASKVPAPGCYPNIRILEVNNGWLKCELLGVSAPEALRTLLQDGVAVSEAARLSGGLEDLYLTHTRVNLA